MSKLLGSLNERRRLKYAINFEQQKGDSFWDLADTLTREQELKQEVLNSKLRRQTFALKAESRRLDNLMIVGHRLEQEEDTIVATDATENISTIVQNESRGDLAKSNITVYSQDPLQEFEGVSPSPVERFYYWIQRFVSVPVREKLARLKTSFLEIINDRHTV
ncbi:uncharacterized protein LOC118403369 [Branchiostoma floridae]|uniref:Uncharacterized protein LOC118403369 n=1 Tax=Branchiostoma floridae TaxID=7739 RepID=C3XSN8_BRAFL|nr:uncharacterized protein LOC118403369 [Branchiostoma floridae]|eukprot:XP_002612950.1 hypothetical protein BRAFLDRAFT_74729 [Branchiostoma floridae]